VPSNEKTKSKTEKAESTLNISLGRPVKDDGKVEGSTPFAPARNNKGVGIMLSPLVLFGVPSGVSLMLNQTLNSAHRARRRVISKIAANTDKYRIHL